jgi:hypothetical protein
MRVLGLPSALTHLPLLVGHVAGGDQVAAHGREDVDEPLAIGVRDARERVAARGIADLAHGLQDRVGCRQEMQEPDAPVGGMGPALDEAGGLELVDDAPERDRLDLEDIGKPALMDALVLGEVREHLPLRPRQAEAPGPLLETLAEEARNVVKDEAERRVSVVGHAEQVN